MKKSERVEKGKRRSVNKGRNQSKKGKKQRREKLRNEE
jgi:hypothetical protein